MPRTRSAEDRELTPHWLPEPPRRLGSLVAARAALRRASSSVASMAGAIFLFVGLVFLVTLVPLLLRDRALAVNGVRTSGTVVGRRAAPARDRGEDSRDVRAWIIQYEFVLADGRTWAAERDVGATVWNTLDVGDRLDVRYAPDDPSRHLLPGTGESVLPIVGALFPVLLLVIGALLVRRGLPEILEPLRLYRDGIVSQARITGAEDVTNLTVNGRHPVRIRYVFRDRAGAELEGATTTMDGELIATLSPGAGATVLYAPDDARRSVLVAALGIEGRIHDRGGHRAASR